MPRSKKVSDQDQLDDQPIADETEQPTEQPTEQEHRGYIPGVADPAAGMLLIGRVTIQD